MSKINSRLRRSAPTEQITSYSTPESLKKYTEDGKTSGVSKSGLTISYGPYRNVPPSSNMDFQQNTQEIVSVHYTYDMPVLTVPKLRRAVEISHWGNNVNVQDDIWLKNDGARLKGHFSRIEHSKQRMMANYAKPHIVDSMVLHLPSGIRDPYYYDTIGNVSTSRFRPAPQRRAPVKGTKVNPLERWSILEMKPRYPLLGGWNYSFTVGYDMPLEEWAVYQDDKVVFGIPFLTSLPDTAFDDVEVKVILPEGAEIVEILPPFPVDVTERSTHITYLDTVGRPAITFKKSGATDKHAGMIYIVYRVSTKAHFQKPITVAAVSMGLFMVVLLLRRADFSIKTTPAVVIPSRKKVA
ncbi:dolichyl-diphosphooligosaccharide--protein glycosyltransferase subunit 1 [Tulasnella sp. 418]|nr:dolichyl-diphosphooligosaccharide--protein glycosyltransferase subunit 1 [Tulasnella sp. 418]